MRQRPRILIDIDGVFANFIEASLPFLRSLTKQHHLGHGDVRSYRMEEVFGLTSEQIAWWYAEVLKPGFCSGIPSYPYAREAITAMQEIGDVHPVTFPWPRAPHWIIEREDWLRDVLGIDPGLAVYTSQKHLVAGDIFVEDTTKYLVRWREHHPNGVAIRVRRPYNEHEVFDGSTVDDLEQLAREVVTVAELRERHWRDLWRED